MFGMGMQELVIVGIIAVLLFGRRLPEVAKSLGSSYREFRKGLTDLQSQINLDEITSNSSSVESSYSHSMYGDFDDHDEVTAPKFEPPPAEPQETEGATPESDAGDQVSDSADADSTSEGDPMTEPETKP